MEESRLGSVPLFRGLTREELQRLARVTDEVRLPSGTRLINEGSFAHEFLLITSGQAEVCREGELVATLGAGDFAGEVGVMSDAKRNASVTATTQLVAIVMTARDLRQVASEMPSVGAQIADAIKLRSAGSQS